MEAFESAGQWWLPEAPETKVVGLLKYSDTDGFRLDIPFGFLGQELTFGRQPERQVVQGFLRDGKYVTLVDCFTVSSNMHMPGSGHEILRAARGFLGETASEADPEVDRVSIGYSHLRDWVIRHPSTCKWPTVGESLGQSADYHYETPENVVLAAEGGWKIVLGHVASLSTPSVEGFHVDHDCRLTVELEQPLPFSDVSFRFLGPLSKFFSFCLDRHISTTHLKVRIAGGEQWLDVGRAQTAESSNDEIIMQPFMLLSMPVIGDRMNKILTRWLSLEGDERRAVSLLAGLIGQRNVPVDLRFLAATQALEALSRVGIDENELAEEEFNRRLEVVLESVQDPKVRKWADRKLKYANHRYADDLLKNLASHIGDYVNALAPATQAFFDDIRSNRNFYTHRDASRVEHILEGEKLYVLTQGVVGLLKAAVLRNLGFDARDTCSLMEECQNILQWRVRVAEQYAESVGA